MKLQCGYDRRKNPSINEYRHLTKEEIMSLSGYALVICNDGKVRTAKINGAVKTWKSDANRIEVPVKYNMYKYARMSLPEALARFVVRVD